VNLRWLVAAGRIGSGGPLLDREHWRAGMRVGVGVETPIGPIHLETGWGSRGRKAGLVRIGRWF
jgi:outer membrane translocation and assembly module TamA